MKQNLHKRSKRIVLAFDKLRRIVLASLVAFLFVSITASPVSAAVVQGMQTSGKTLSNEASTGNCSTDKMPFGYEYELSKEAATGGGYDVGLNDPLRLNVKLIPVQHTGTEADLQTMIANCQRMARDGKIQFNLRYEHLTVNPRQGTTDTRLVKTINSVKAVALENGFIGASFPSMTIGNEGASYVNQTIWGQLSVSWEQNQYNSPMVSIQHNLKTDPTGRDIQIPDLGSGGTGSTGTGGLKDFSKFNISIAPTSDGNGLKNLYRTWVGDTQPMVFGSPTGPSRINVTCAPANECPVKDDPILLPNKDDQWGPDLNPTYEYFDGGFNLTSNVQANVVACAPRGWFGGSECPNTFFGVGNLTAFGLPSGPASSLSSGLNPTINATVWANTPAGGSVELTFLPRLVMDAPLSVGVQYFVVYNLSSAKTKIEVYATKEEVKAKCVSENSANPTVCDDDNFIRYQVGQNVVGTASTTEQPADGAVSKLFNFIRSVIAYIVLLLTSFIYYIFSIILVPVLVALLQIQAYKDNFVNFIYPGWVIIRNISNILFIIALLWIGLRTLFQVDDASKSRSFIVRLILMALLVNFSLVIGQAIVGIADTVQAQFLPKDSRVVEALGHKLMVDPIITFRGGADLDASGNFTSNSFASDLPKAIILLVLAVAAFFAFVALIAFIFVRLGMLWLLYMLSPLAYVAQILPETKEYGKKWFTEFLRYAFVVPILAFFLNMTALIAVTFSRTSGDQVQVEGSGTTALGGLVPTGDAAAGIVEFAVTVMSHFIVLVFLFGGMAFAQKFGGVGSKQIVSFAKKGFDAVTKRPAMWAARGAGNLAKSYGKEQYERKIAGGLLDPKAWKEGWKGRISTETNTQKSNRLLKKDGKLNPGIATQYMGTSLKYLFHKMTFGAPHRLLSEADRLKEQASIFTENERLAKEVKLGENQSVKQIYDAFKTGIPETGPINVAGLLGSLGTQITDFENQGNLKADNLEIEANTLEANGNMSGAAAKRAEAASVLQEYEDKVKELNKVKDKLDPATNGGVDVNSDPGLRKQISNDLEKSIEELAKNIEDSQKQIKDNNVLKQKYGVTGDLPESERERLRKQAESLEQKASERKLPESLAIRALLREGQKKEMEKYDGVDDPDELIAIHKKAMKDNNLLLATAIQKKLAKEGFFKDLLQSEGGRNNIESMQAFFAKNLKGMAPNVRMQVMSEVSYLNKQSNNLALSNATKMDAETGSLRLATLEEQAKKVNGFLESRNPNDLSNLKADQVVREREDGKNEIFGGYVNAMKKHMESLSAIEFDKYVPKIPTNVAKKVANATNFGDFNPQGTAIGNKIQQAFKDRGK